MSSGRLAGDLEGDDPLRGSFHALNRVRAFRIYTPPLPRMPAARGVLSLSLASASSESDSTDAAKPSSSSKSVSPITDHATGDEGASDTVESLAACSSCSMSDTKSESTSDVCMSDRKSDAVST
jgi:hypothetical protein